MDSALATTRALPASDEAAVRAEREEGALTLPCTLAGRYHLDRYIGGDGMGHVYGGRDQPLDRQVAVKTLRCSPALCRERALDRFRTEARRLAELTHPGVVRVLDAAPLDEPDPWFVMELVDGPSLDRYVRQHQPPLRWRVRVALELCRAMAHVHAAGVLHRDRATGPAGPAAPLATPPISPVASTK